MKKYLLAASLLLSPLPAFADQPVQDTVTFQLKAEDWVQATTARVTVALDASLPGTDAAKVRQQMQQAVAALGEADWRFASFDHGTDQSGLETWHAELEARVKESALGGLADKAKAASKPGMQLKVTNTEFTPTLAETEAVKAKLRSQIYAAANDELKRLQTAEPDRKFRLGGVDFEENTPGGGPVIRQLRGNAMAIMPAAAAPASSDGEVNVQQKMVLQARVTLASGVVVN
jgi:hypothetical protein